MGHSMKTCPSRGCLKCNARHNTMLHKPETTQGKLGNDPTRNRPTQVTAEGTNTVHAAFNQHSETPSYVFLGTAVLNTKDTDGQTISCRAILDSGSQLNFISEHLFSKLGFKGNQQKVEISGIGDSKLQTQGRINLLIQSRINGFSARIEAFVLPEITSLQPSQMFNTSSWPIPKNIELADLDFNKPRRVDILLGADIYCDLMSIGQIKLGRDLPTLQNSVLGWVVFGKMRRHSNPTYGFYGISTDTLEGSLQRFWTLEEPNSSVSTQTEAERSCEEHFNKTTTQDSTGRFIVKLPFAQPPESLGNSREIAMRRFFNLERRLNKDKSLKAQYKAFIKELLDLNHMEQITFEEIPKVHYFLPHHCVLKPESTTTKLRVVFDGSCKTSNNTSLNDILLVGPKVQDDLFSILIRFRLYKYVFTADITKMYRQILVSKEHQNLQLIVWRDNPFENLRCYRLRTVTYGTAAASYLATKCLQRLAENQEENYPLGSRIARRDFYVDDIMSGSNSLREACKMQEQVRKLLLAGGFQLRKWCANHPKLLLSIPKEERETIVNVSEIEGGQVKTLGLIWYPNSDLFAIRTNLPEIKRVTKRSILADIAHVYDPLGLVNPVVCLAKIFMQQLWQLKVDWDAAISQELTTKWLRFRDGLKELNTVTIPRHVMSPDEAVNIQLHAFADASERAYGTAIYIRSTDRKSRIFVHLLCAKSKVAPLKKTTLPRLELCAAQLAVKLVKRIRETMHISINDVFYWTDSTVTLSWINSPSSSFKTFVAHRVSYIQGLTEGKQWKHVSTKLNPADLVSRGITATQILSNTLWFQGPSFLQEETANWPNHNPARTDNEIEKRKIKIALDHHKSNQPIACNQSSEFLQSATSYCRIY